MSVCVIQIVTVERAWYSGIVMRVMLEMGLVWSRCDCLGFDIIWVPKGIKISTLDFKGGVEDDQVQIWKDGGSSVDIICPAAETGNADGWDRPPTLLCYPHLSQNESSGRPKTLGIYDRSTNKLHCKRMRW